MSGLYGEVELKNSIGLSRPGKFSFVNNSHACYASGNAIMTIDLSEIHAISMKNSISKEMTSAGAGEANHASNKKQLELLSKPKLSNEFPHSVFIKTDSSITALAAYHRENVIAYAESQGSYITVCNWPTKNKIGPNDGSLLADTDLYVQNLAFSFDGDYLASLGYLPNFQIIIWNWRLNSQICSINNNSPAKYISFNPSDSTCLCISGDSERIKFLKIKLGIKKSTISSIDGEEFARDNISDSQSDSNPFHKLRLDSSEKKVTPAAHAWAPNGDLLATSDGGNEVIRYNPINGRCMVFIKDSFQNESELFNGAHNFKCILPLKNGIFLIGKDGILRNTSYDGEYMHKIRSLESISITNVCISPDYKLFLLESDNGCLYCFHLQGRELFSLINDDNYGMEFMQVLTASEILVTASQNKGLVLWDLKTCTAINRYLVPGNITSIATSPCLSLIAVGTDLGYIRLYAISTIQNQSPSLIMIHRAHSKSITKISFDKNGNYFFSHSEEGYICIYECNKKFEPIGYIAIPGKIQTGAWIWENDEEAESLYLFVLAIEEKENESFVFRIGIPHEKDLFECIDQRKHFIGGIFPTIIYKISEILTDIVPISSSTTQGAISFYAVSTNRQVKNYVAPLSMPKMNTDDVYLTSDSINIKEPAKVFTDHQKSRTNLCLSTLEDWIFTWSEDGVITLRTLMELDKSLQILSHDPFIGGTTAFFSSPDCKNLYSLGADNTLKIWEWKYTSTGKKYAAEAVTAIQDLVDSQSNIISDYSEALAEKLKSTVLSDVPDDPKGNFMSILHKNLIELENTYSAEKDTYLLQFESKIQSIKEKIISAMARNETLPQIERLQPEDFVINFKERDRLLVISESKINQVRAQIETENLKKRIIRSRIKHECWDSMEVVGQSVKSFLKDPIMNRILDVTNYPIRKRSNKELEKVEKIKRLRKVQLLLANFMDSNKNSIEDADLQNSSGINWDKIHSTPNYNLFYQSFELICNERRIIQAYLINEYLLELKIQYNSKFNEFARLKQDELSKIEEKNSRIIAILAELDVKEGMNKPELDEDEQPERIITVADNEVKEERYLTLDEKKKLEEKAKAEKRLLSQQFDNYRERALIDMMNGKLEDRAEKEEKEVLVRPEWMEKSKEDMSEEERKLVKEFEKKMTLFKEEQEKYRKGLETELRKLQSSIIETCQSFDLKLREFFDVKIDSDVSKFKCELKIIKLFQFCSNSRKDEITEAQLYKKLEFLKSEKARYNSDIPDVKKELERCKEEYDVSLKRDKEAEKAFKKDMHVYETHFDVLYKLYKRRQIELTEDRDADDLFSKDALSPYSELEKTMVLEDSSAISLSMESDFPEGLHQEVWNRLVDQRDKKIILERECRTALKQVNYYQFLVTFITEENENIRIETEKTIKEIESFQEYKFQSMYNVETLYEMKQGQVEVPQAPMVTDYNDSVLINRNAVEKLNSVILKLGKSKVDALIEMKNYRKGIHALEWENKLFDFQSEDLIIKIRDIQLLRVTKEMQEFIRSGDDQKHAAEIVSLEKRVEYGGKAHEHKLDEKKKIVLALEKKIRDKELENKSLDSQLSSLELAVRDRKDIYNVSLKRDPTKSNQPLKDIYSRRKLMDLAKSQAQDIAILREEVERLRLRTYPAFHAS